MNNSSVDACPTLDSVQQRFEAWRNSRARREPIPEPLWEAAASLCRRHPITHVCRRLRLSFTELKKRLSTSKSAPLQFMELDPSCLAVPWRIECERPDGSKLGFSGSGEPPSIEALLIRFLS